MTLLKIKNRCKKMTHQNIYVPYQCIKIKNHKGKCKFS